MKKVMKEFKDFIAKGNVFDMAVGIIIGGAFTAIVTSLVNDIINPVLNTILGGFSFDILNVTIKMPWVTLMQKNGINVEYPVICFGSFISAIIGFLITAIALFFVVKGINKLKNAGKKPEEEAAPTVKMCPYCKSEINIEATRCPHCTSQL